MKFRKVALAAAALGVAVALAACSGGRGGDNSSGTDNKGALVGVAMPTKVSERWIADGNAVKSDLEKNGYKVDLEYANNDIPTQVQQVNTMITKGAKVLIVASIDGGSLTDQLDAAAKAGIKVISYDRLLTGDKNVDYYVSFDNYKVGVYQANYRLGIVMMMFVSMFEFAWRPFFLQQASKPNARQLYARVFTYFNLLAALIFLLFGFYIVNIAAIPLPFRSARTVIHPQYWRGLTIVPIILSSYIFNGWYTNFIAGVYIEKKTQALTWITSIAAAASVVLCFVLMPPLEIVGGAWATWLSYLVMALVLYFYIQRYYRIEYEWGRVARIAIGVVGIWTINMVLLDFDDRSLHAAMIRLGLLLLFPAWLFVSGFFHKEEQRELSRLLARFRGGEGRR